MEQRRVSQLKVGAPLTRPIFHSSGEMLMGTARVLTSELARLLREAGIEEVLRPQPGEDSGEFIRNAKNLVMPVGDLKVGQRMTQPVFDRSGALLVETGAVVSERMATSLRRRGIKKIYVRKSTQDLGLGQVQAFRRALRKLTGRRPQPVRGEIDASRLIKAEDCNAQAVDQMIDAGGEIAVPRGEAPLLEEMTSRSPMDARSEGAKDGFLAMYELAIADTERIFRAFERGGEVDEEEVGSLARQVVGGLIEDRDLLFNLSNLKTDYNYLLGHSLGVTVLATSVAAALGHDRKAVLEIGYAGYLHDVGMLRVPGEIVGKTGKLTHMEMIQVRRHPVFGLDMLQRLVGRRSGLPVTVPLAAYQSHERANGSGYPKGRKGQLIHDFAKIVAICDAYEAMTSPRPWREAMLPYRAMEQLVLGASRQVFSPDMVKSLLRCASLFPIGSWVELSDESFARVVASTEGDYTRPVVSVVFLKDQRLENPQRIDLAQEKDLNISRSVPTPADVRNVMEGF